MKFEFKDEDRASGLVQIIEDETPDERVKIVHVCGTHEVTITENGIRSLLPNRIDIREGPGCPVCVTPTEDLDAAVKLAEDGVVVAAFGDMLDVPGTEKSLREAKSEGADVRLVYGAGEAVEIAEETDEEVVFLSVGFETTSPTVAAVLSDGAPDNFSVLASNKLIPPAMKALLELPESEIDGFIAPGHVSTIIGVEPYEELAETYGVPVAVGGFEPLDVLYALALLVRQVSRGEAKVENGYERAVNYRGNPRSRELIEEVFAETESTWRGIGELEGSGLELRSGYEKWDATERFDIDPEPGNEVLPGCRCPEVITARTTPDKCDLFREECTPDDPHGPCMVGEEAMCNIWYRYGGRPKL